MPDIIIDLPKLFLLIVSTQAIRYLLFFSLNFEIVSLMVEAEDNVTSIFFELILNNLILALTINPVRPAPPQVALKALYFSLKSKTSTYL